MEFVFLNHNRALKSTKLSKRQIEVQMLVAKGLTNQEIADELFVCLATIKLHLNKIYKKLGISSRYALILYRDHK